MHPMSVIYRQVKNTPNECKGEKKMTTKIKVNNKRQLNKLVKEYRNNGYFLITLGHTLAELEKESELVVIEF